MDDKRQKEVREYLARIKKTVEASQALMESVDLRLKETDRLLESQGLTRDEIRKMRFSKEQRVLANQELTRMGLPPLEEEDTAIDFDLATANYRDSLGDSADAEDESVLAARQRKFGTFMQQFRL